MVWLFTLCLFGQTKTMGKKKGLWNQNFCMNLFWSFWKFLFKENPQTLITYHSQPRDIFLQMISSTNYSDASGLTVFNTYFFFFYTHKIKQQYGCSSCCLRAGLLSRPPACVDLSDSLNGPLKWQWRVETFVCRYVIKLAAAPRFIKLPRPPDAVTAWRQQYYCGVTLERFYHITYRCVSVTFDRSAASLLHRALLPDVTLLVV